jgi:hypothetical protein
MKRLEGIEGIMRKQIRMALSKGVRVDVSVSHWPFGPLPRLTKQQKVILIGGFAASCSLQSHLGRCITKISEEAGQNIELVVPGNQFVPSTLVVYMTQYANA